MHEYRGYVISDSWLPDASLRHPPNFFPTLIIPRHSLQAHLIWLPPWLNNSAMNPINPVANWKNSVDALKRLRLQCNLRRIVPSRLPTWLAQLQRLSLGDYQARVIRVCVPYFSYVMNRSTADSSVFRQPDFCAAWEPRWCSNPASLHHPAGLGTWPLISLSYWIPGWTLLVCWRGSAAICPPRLGRAQLQGWTCMLGALKQGCPIKRWRWSI